MTRRRLVVGNLDCEVAWAASPPLPAAVMTRLALLATTLRVFADRPDDRLWLPRALDPAVIPDDDGPHPALVSGVRPAAATTLAWGALPDAAPGAAAAPTAVGSAPAPGPATRWRAALATLPPPPLAIARAVNDRRFALALATELGVALPGARVVGSLAELRRHLADGGADASPTGAWVAKAPLTAAGRDRVRRRGAVVDAPTATRVERLLAIHGALVFEPWMERVLDVSQGGVVLGPDRAIVVAPHRGVCDPSGVIRAIAIDDGEALAPGERLRLAAVAVAVATRLGAVGYQGPFVVDGYRHRGGFHPLGEINARLTFGLIARAWAEHRGHPIILGLGGPPPPGAIALVHDPAAPTVPAAWLAPR